MKSFKTKIHRAGISQSTGCQKHTSLTQEHIRDYGFYGFQISRLQLFEMINGLFADTVVISHHEKLREETTCKSHVNKG